MNTQLSQDDLDYAYIEKLKIKSERQLELMKNSLTKEITKIKAEKARLESKLNDKIKKEHFIKDMLMEKWRTPSPELLEAIKEVEKGETEVCENMEEFKIKIAE